jgi:predicted kinase
MLIIFGGLPGTSKSTLARQLAEKLGVVYLRINTIERAVADGDEAGSIDDKGYCVVYALAEDNLRLGRTVIGDPVNPLQITREARRGVAERAAERAVEKEVICSDLREHRCRIETRLTDLPVTCDEVVTRKLTNLGAEIVFLSTPLARTLHKAWQPCYDCWIAQLIVSVTRQCQPSVKRQLPK